ncbi:putative Zn(II)2Cys6 transcription factor [Aspergillus heteromorphus CBS 117.55]|uniref:Putative Zn(II)2Cys6 transcription factor n=1 Tax=Aspergillus heteromorphus CBS 117.55 TaxID=1448321 RepID=A0A317V2Y1_9EURO|nr:putative Zn(II)2Cys6 transcription factor [Aspergillus heteromorphus CBS 117.55]PWY68623.1 putative Zn(II)2Cys6 transcription factor [Aspergillus heteromorphus CBS 117.55]
MDSQSRASQRRGSENQHIPLHRRKRVQVARACGSCRVRRIRCDDSQTPCSNCVRSGSECSNSRAPTAFTLAQANQEIASLKQKVQELETELKHRCNCNGDRDSDSAVHIGSTPTPTALASGFAENTTAEQYWGGVHFRPARSHNSLWLGPSSLYSYIQRLSGFLSLNFNHEQPAHQLLPISASDNRLLDRPVTGPDQSPIHPPFPSTCTSPSSSCVYLTPLQEDFFINHFWQTFHVSLFPILDEAHFKKHYQSLWIAGGKERKPSALVDIVVAMCMQYHISTLPLDSQTGLLDGKDALVAGRWHYWRGQTLLTYELESPTLSTLQCHLLCAVYLCGGSFHNMMDSSVSLAVRTAYILGLHVDPPPSMSTPDREMRRRLWWAVYLMDSKAGMKLGRPFMLSDSHATPALPSDTFSTASTSGSTFVPIGENTTWLSFNLHQTKLYMRIRAAYNAFFNKDFQLQPGQTIWDNPCALQSGAEVLAQHTQLIQAWTDSVPDALKLTRQNNGTPFSTDGTRLVIEQFIPPWLQRQRILLELTYHHLNTNLYRPLISFTNHQPPLPNLPTDPIITRCATHAIALSKLTHQIITETTILSGWHESFHTQWNATITLIGYITIYPSTPLTSEIRNAIDLAVAVFEHFGAKFPAAANAMRIVRGLCGKVDEILAQHRSWTQTGSWDGSSRAAILWEDSGSSVHQETSSYGNSVSQPPVVDGNEISGPSELDLLGLALDVDFWNEVYMLWPETDLDMTCSS